MIPRLGKSDIRALIYPVLVATSLLVGVGVVETAGGEKSGMGPVRPARASGLDASSESQVDFVIGPFTVIQWPMNVEVADGEAGSWPFEIINSDFDSLGDPCSCVVEEVDDPYNVFISVMTGCSGTILIDADRPRIDCWAAEFVIRNVCDGWEMRLIASVHEEGWFCEPLCYCPYQGDEFSNGSGDAVDLALVIDIVFFGGVATQDLWCPTARSDFNADGFTDAVDAANMIDYVFFGGPGPVDPCG